MFDRFLNIKAAVTAECIDAELRWIEPVLESLFHFLVFFFVNINLYFVSARFD